MINFHIKNLYHKQCRHRKSIVVESLLYWWFNGDRTIDKEYFMNGGDGTEIPTLNYYMEEMNKSIHKGTLLTFKRLSDIADYIRCCDQLVSDRFEAVKLITVNTCLQHYCQYWLKHHRMQIMPDEFIVVLKTKKHPAQPIKSDPDTTSIEVIKHSKRNPPKTLDEIMSNQDKAFLKLIENGYYNKIILPH